MMSLQNAALLLAEAGLNTQISGHEELRFSGVCTDSRNIQAGDLFVALSGEKFDGHDFLEQVQALGAVAALVSKAPVNSTHALPQLRVADTRIALGALARSWRESFDIPVIAVTGSNGKTTVKEMIASILAEAYGAENRLATIGNLNNDIGVPLTLLRLRSHHRAAVVELGINHPGETEWLAGMTQPNVVLINNAQREHQEFMESVSAVAYEHALAISALPGDGIAVIPAQDAYAQIWINAAELDLTSRCIVSFAVVAEPVAGASMSATYETRLSETAAGTTAPDEHGGVTVLARPYLEVDGSVIHLATPDDSTTIKLHVAGLHNVHNAAAATAAALVINVPMAAIHRGLENFRPVKGRMQHLRSASGLHLIDDSYNANPDSVRAAIDVLASCPRPTVLVLGDMGEVGDQGDSFHREIGRYARDKNITVLITFGPSSAAARAEFHPEAFHAESIEQLVAHLLDLELTHATVLVKGSRFMRMERVVAALMGHGVGQALEPSH